MAQLDLSNVVVVSVQTAPAGIADFNVANLCLLTDEQPNASAVLTNGLLYYRSFTQLSQDWPTTSRVYETGSLYFSQSANGLLAGGMLIVAPNQADAVQVTLHTDYTDEGDYIIYGTDSKTVKQPTLITDDVGNTFYLRGNDVTITSEESQALALVTIGDYKQPDQEAGDQTLKDDQNVVLGTYDPTNNTEGLRLPVDHFNTVSSAVFFGCSVYLTADDYTDYFKLQLASASAAVHRIYGGFTSNVDDLRVASGADAGGWVYQAKSNGRFFKAVYDSRNPYAIIATAFGYIQSTVFTGSDTAITLFAKDLTGITADPTMTEALKVTCENAGVDFVGLIGGQNWFWSSKMYLDEMYGLLYTEYAMLVAYTNVIRTTFTKIPQTEKGMLIIKNALAQVCDQLVTCGLLAPGKWNNPSKFGDIDDFEEQISLVGYYIYSEPITSQTQSQREDRQAPLIQIAGKGAGAIQGGSLIFQFEA